MALNDISPAVRQLIARHIGTVKDLEVLLLLAENPREWTAAAVGESMYIQPEAAGRLLDGLAASGLVQRTEGNPPTFRYDSSNGSDTAVRELDVLYSRMRVRIIEMIYETPSSAIQSFADAFKFKRGGE